MTELRIAPDLTLPREAVTETFAILAKRGVGKSYTASVFAEELLKAGLHVVVIDPLDVWWGLRAAADGEGPGLPIIVLGGAHGDLPLEATSGTVLADLVVDERLPVVLSLRHLSKGEQRRFVTDFAERLYHRKGEPDRRDPLQLIIDEADAYVPQRVMAGQERMVGAIDDLVRRGRASGIGVTLITQRAAVIHKDVLTQSEVLIALRTVSPQDRAALKAWIEAHDAHDQGAEFLGSLASLEIGEAWVWSPGWLGIFQRVQVRRRETFDSSATPKAGQALTAPRAFAPVDLAALRERLAATVERAEEQDPARLWRRITELERQIAARVTPKPERIVERVEVPVLDPALAEQLLDATASLRNLGQHVTDVAIGLRAALSVAALPTNAALPPTSSNKPVTASKQRAAASDAAPKATARPGREPSLEDETRLLAALATFPDEPLSRDQMSVLAGLSVADDTLDRLLTLAKRRALVTVQGGELVLTATGRDRLGDAAPLPADIAAERRAVWSAHLDGRERRILEELIALHPEQASMADLADRTGYPANGGFYGAVGRLVRLGLATKDGTLRGLGPMALGRTDGMPPRLRTVEA